MSTIPKPTLRKFALAYRKLLSDSEYEKRNQMLLDMLEDYLLESQTKSIHAFLPIAKNNEPSIMPLLPNLWKREVVIISSITDFKKKEMKHYFI